MSLDVRSLVANGLGLAFDLMPLSAPGAKNVRRPGTYRRRRGASYDPATGIATPGDTDVALEFLLAPYTEKEVDGEVVQAGDERAVVRFSDLRSAGVDDVSEDDLLLEEGEQDRQVVGIFVDPTGQALVLQTRKVTAASSSASSGSGPASSS